MILIYRYTGYTDILIYVYVYILMCIFQGILNEDFDQVPRTWISEVKQLTSPARSVPWRARHGEGIFLTEITRYWVSTYVEICDRPRWYIYIYIANMYVYIHTCLHTQIHIYVYIVTLHKLNVSLERGKIKRIKPGVQLGVWMTFGDGPPNNPQRLDPSWTHHPGHYLRAMENMMYPPLVE